MSILATALNRGKPIETLSIDFEDARYSEKEHQQTIVDLIGSNHNSLTVTEQDFIESWEDIQLSLDQPTTDGINNYFICKFAKQKGCKVVLSGLGADELFGGYPSFNRTAQVASLRALSRLHILKSGIAAWGLNYPHRKIDFLKNKIAAGEYLTYRGLFTPTDVAKILHIQEKEVWRILSTFQMPDEYNQVDGSKNKVAAFECGIYMLGQLLKDADMQSMWHGVELRVPFLDVDLVNFVHQLPEKIKYPEGGHKYLLTKSFKVELPDSIVNRKKQGFVFPFETWLANIESLKNEMLVPKNYFERFKNNRFSAAKIWAIYLSNIYRNNISFKKNKVVIHSKNLFIYLSSFGATGGIEKVNKLIIKSFKIEENFNSLAQSYGLHDNHFDSRYVKPYAFKGFSGNRFKFLYQLSKIAKNYNQVIVGHINLSPAVFLMRIFNPKLKIVLMAHGIEVWGPQTRLKKWLLTKADKIISVSNYTKERIISDSSIKNTKITVLQNALDPYFKVPDLKKRLLYLKKRYGIKNNDKIILTITRMSSADQYKGYDLVLGAISNMDVQQKSEIKYILAGKSDKFEYERISILIQKYGLEEIVIRPGFIEDSELQDHFQLAKLFVMPSKKEGFGIVLIEAFASGSKVIAGNGDGSKEALQNGKFGKLIDINNLSSLKSAIDESLLENNNPLDTNHLEAFNYYDSDKYMRNFTNLALAK